MSICSKCANDVCRSDKDSSESTLYPEEMELCKNFIKKMAPQRLKEEAIERMRMLSFHPNVEKEWEEDEKVNYSEPVKLGRAVVGVLYWLDNQPEFAEAVREAEEEFGIKVYHALHTNTEFGDLLSCLYVGSNEEIWPQDRSDLERKMPDGSREVMAYVINLSDPMLSEFGYIGIKEACGGLIRVY